MTNNIQTSDVLSQVRRKVVSIQKLIIDSSKLRKGNCMTSTWLRRITELQNSSNVFQRYTLKKNETESEQILLSIIEDISLRHLGQLLRVRKCSSMQGAQKTCLLGRWKSANETGTHIHLRKSSIGLPAESGSDIYDVCQRCNTNRTNWYIFHSCIIDHHSSLFCRFAGHGGHILIVIVRR